MKDNHHTKLWRLHPWERHVSSKFDERTRLKRESDDILTEFFDGELEDFEIARRPRWQAP